MTTRIDSDVLIPGRGDPISQGSVVFDEKIRGKTDRFVYRFRKPR